MDSQSQLQPPPENLLAPLLELRNYYAQSVEKYEKLYTEALENLNRVEALLSNWSSHSSVEVTPKVLPASSGENQFGGNSNKGRETSANLAEPVNGLVAQTNEQEVENLSTSNQNIEIRLVTDEVVTTADEEKSLSDNSDNMTETSANVLEPIKSEDLQPNDLDSNESSDVSTQPDEPPVSTSTVVETTSDTQAKSDKSSDIPMQQEYQSLSRSEAIQKILQQYAGGICHIDMLVRLLYGELEPDVFKVVKGRVQSTLTKGRESGRWFGVPGKPGYYTIDLKLLNSKRASSSKKSSKKSSLQGKTKDEKPSPQVKTEDEKPSLQVKTEDEKPSPLAKTEDKKPSPLAKTKDKKPQPQAKTNGISMQGEFEGKVLINAISSLLEQNSRKVFDVAEVINKLYGELNPEQVQEVKPKVLKELSRGNKTGRFSRVPEEKGLYIWDSKALPEEIRQ